MNNILIIIFSCALLFGGDLGSSIDIFSSTTSVLEKDGSKNDLEILTIERDEMESQILTRESFIVSYKKNQVDKWEKQIANNLDSPMVPKWKEALKDTTEYLEQQKLELTTLRQQLADLDAQIADLQK
ncbi:hypothetical protein [Paenibacillus graminis]|uniref:hypothetical protein n=1 Tax=Paenibacillus graminis TaxID=189425 RepID=UPI002DB6A5EB|nr:hypothetical protein [Paenibacillus graminis]MEC0168865.1 hypothetical protein [Paenibacillus graminis]